MKDKCYRWIGAALVIVLMLPALLAVPFATAQEDGSYWPTDGWRTSTPEAQGMDSAELAAFVNTWAGTMDSLLIIRHGYIVAEVYPSPNQPETRHDVMSISKVLTGSLLGIAIQEGALPSLDTPVLSFFPDRTVENLDANKEALNLMHLVTMTSGLDCGDMVRNFAVSAAIEATDDWVQSTLDLPIVTPPGSQFDYCNMNSYLLSTIIGQATGESLLAYGQEKLFGPLGITDLDWKSDPNGVTLGYSGVTITPRDLAKFGYLYLHNGEWDGTQIVSANYVQDSLTGYAETGWPDLHFGYGWWIFDSVSLPWSLGIGGQYLYVMPDKDMVVVVTQGGYPEAVRPMLQGYPMSYALANLSASDEALPENPDGMSQMQDAVMALSSPAAADVPAMPALAQQVSGLTYNLMNPGLLIAGQERSLVMQRQQGLLDVQAMSLVFGEGSEATLAVTFADGEMWNVPVGLDQVYRVSEGRLTPVGVRGLWITENTFRIEMKYIGTRSVLQLDISFRPGAVQVVTFEKSTGTASIIYGIMAR